MKLTLTEAELNLLVRVLSQVQGNAQTVSQIFMLRQGVLASKETDMSMEINLTDANALAAIVMGHNKYSVDDTPVLVTITQKVASILKELQTGDTNGAQAPQNNV